jgi:hypothetical protein
MGQMEIKSVLPHEGRGMTAVDIAAALGGENVGTIRVLLTRIRNARDPELVTHEEIINGVSTYHYVRRLLTP